jgi:predicted flap endonuclease-1-like 5' DNA nuclease
MKRAHVPLLNANNFLVLVLSRACCNGTVKFRNEEHIMTSLSKVEGIGEKYAAKLQAAGVTSLESLLETGKTPQGRKRLAETVEVSEKLILEWINHADLFRINGIGEEYSDLLEEAGVDTVVELAQRNPENLLAKMSEVNAQKNLVRRLPVLSQVQDWVDQAKKLPRVIEY